MFRKTLGGLLVALAAILMVSAGQAYAGGGGSGGGGGVAHGIQVVGKITALNKSSGSVTLTIGTYYNPTAVFYVDATTKVTLNGKSSLLSDMKVGDTVTAVFDDRSVLAKTFYATR